MKRKRHNTLIDADVIQKRENKQKNGVTSEKVCNPYLPNVTRFENGAVKGFDGD